MDPRLVVDIEKRYPGFRLQVQLAVGTEVLVLYGPSGAGKTQTLRAIAGLVRPDRGEIWLDGRPLFRCDGGRRPLNVPAHKRRIGYVFQDYALFPHLTALENVAFGLRGPRRREEALSWLRRMRLEHVAHLYPSQLSGGQRQRVAIARTLATAPSVLFLDEPFSALDLDAKRRLQEELRQLQRELGLPVVYVTHSLEDAFAVGHRIAVIADGRLQQVGPLSEVVAHPANWQVARAFGLPNLVRARVRRASADGLHLDWDGQELLAAPRELSPGEEVLAYIRPEEVRFIYPDRPLSAAVRHNRLRVRVLEQRLVRDARLVRVRTAGPPWAELEVRSPPSTYADLALVPDSELEVAIRPSGIVVLEALAQAEASAEGSSPS
ncbi:MAG TPA: ABC transporter ATP-binding protein [Dehalococcoidia bacterium]|nr:ABC transporter ATP-binding protein [Dehalococcoidia bacterium]